MLPPISIYTDSMATAATELKELHNAHTSGETDGVAPRWHVTSADTEAGTMWGIQAGPERESRESIETQLANWGKNSHPHGRGGH